MEQLNLETLRQTFESGTIKGFETTDGTKRRLFISENGRLCAFNKGSRSRGYALYSLHLEGFKQYIKDPSEALTPEQQEYKTAHKYLTYSEKANFSNTWLDKCLAISKDYNTWVEAGKPRLYDLGITTGNKIDGKVITVKSIGKTYPHIIEQMQKAISEGKNYTSGTWRFRGYDMSLEIAFDPDNGDMIGYLNMEYKDCANGYYYLLINENTFIGYDVD